MVFVFVFVLLYCGFDWIGEVVWKGRYGMAVRIGWDEMSGTEWKGMESVGGFWFFS